MNYSQENIFINQKGKYSRFEDKLGKLIYTILIDELYEIDNKQLPKLLVRNKPILQKRLSIISEPWAIIEIIHRLYENSQKIQTGHIRGRNNQHE